MNTKCFYDFDLLNKNNVETSKNWLTSKAWLGKTVGVVSKMENIQTETTSFLLRRPNQSFDPTMPVKAEWMANVILVLICLLLSFTDPAYTTTKAEPALASRRAGFHGSFWLPAIMSFIIFLYT